MAVKFPNMKKETDIQLQKSQRVPSKMNPKRHTPRHIIIKVAKTKKRDLKEVREKQRVTYKETHVSLSADDFFFFLQKLYRPEKSGMIYLKY